MVDVWRVIHLAVTEVSTVTPCSGWLLALRVMKSLYKANTKILVIIREVQLFCLAVG